MEKENGFKTEYSRNTMDAIVMLIMQLLYHNHVTVANLNESHSAVVIQQPIPYAVTYTSLRCMYTAQEQ